MDALKRAAPKPTSSVTNPQKVDIPLCTAVPNLMGQDLQLVKGSMKTSTQEPVHTMYPSVLRFRGQNVKRVCQKRLGAAGQQKPFDIHILFILTIISM